MQSERVWREVWMGAVVRNARRAGFGMEPAACRESVAAAATATLKLLIGNVSENPNQQPPHTDDQQAASQHHDHRPHQGFHPGTLPTWDREPQQLT